MFRENWVKHDNYSIYYNYDLYLRRNQQSAGWLSEARRRHGNQWKPTPSISFLSYWWCNPADSSSADSPAVKTSTDPLGLMEKRVFGCTRWPPECSQQEVQIRFRSNGWGVPGEELHVTPCLSSSPPATFVSRATPIAPILMTTPTLTRARNTTPSSCLVSGRRVGEEEEPIGGEINWIKLNYWA